MELSNEQETIIKKKLSCLSNKLCQVCGSNNWELQKEIGVLPIYDIQYKMCIEGAHYPVVLIVCKNCSNTLLFSAKDFGLL